MKGGRESMIWIKWLRLAPAQPRAAQPYVTRNANLVSPALEVR